MKCAACNELPAVFRDFRIGGRVCFRCLQGYANKRMTQAWCTMLRQHCVMSDVYLTRFIAEFLWGDGVMDYCGCGLCRREWILRGWWCPPERSVIGPENMVLRKMTAAALGLDLRYFGDRQCLVVARSSQRFLSEEGGEGESADDDDSAEEVWLEVG